MMLAERVEFMDRPGLALGHTVSGHKIDKIEIHHEEFEDHSEMIILVYSGKTLAQKFWDFPCCVTFKLPVQDESKGDPI